MTDDDLKEQLEIVHQELEKASQLTAHERDFFGSLMTDIVSRKAKNGRTEEEHESFKQRIEHYITDIEERHPQLAGALRQVMDSLNRIGI